MAGKKSFFEHIFSAIGNLIKLILSLTGIAIILLIVIGIASALINNINEMQQDKDDDTYSEKDDKDNENQEDTELSDKDDEEEDEEEDEITKEKSGIENNPNLINITKSYYNNNKNINSSSSNIKNVSYVWSYDGIKKWAAEWKIPMSVINEARSELQSLETISRTGITEDELSKVNKKLQKLYKVIGGEWSTPEEYWEAVYTVMRLDNDKRVKIISRIFEYAINHHNMRAGEDLIMISSFIQHIHYLIPNNYFEIHAPLDSILKDEGDCDTKSLLIGMILKNLGYETLILYSSHYRHAMAGINLNGFGDYITYKGKKYSILETTAKGWLIGMLPPDVSDLRYWYPIEL